MTDPSAQAAFGQKLSDSARELANATVTTLKHGTTVHPATAIAACARMAGTLMFRTFNVSLPGLQPGQAVLSQDATAQGDMLMRVTANILANLKVTLPAAPPSDDGNPNLRPTLDFLTTQRRLEPVFQPILNRFEFTPVQAAQASAVAAALLIHHFAKHVDPAVGFRLATHAIVEGCKTAPDPIRH